MILIDPPMWAAHDTLFSHLVSDTSLAQLHRFAASAGIPDGAFDGDHYDVPAVRHGQLVDQGAVPVSAGELIRRLRASGLRLPARERPERVRQVLRQRWQHVAPQAPALGAELIERWSEPHRRYHTAVHLLDVLTALEKLCAPATPPLEVVLAAWFHDAVYDGVEGADERASADLARTRLVGARLHDANAAEVERLVLLTRTHSPGPDDPSGALLCDADLSVLGRSPEGYARYLRAVRAEYGHLSGPRWRTGRSAVVQRLLSNRPLFHTRVGTGLWEAPARENLKRELAGLNRSG